MSKKITNNLYIISSIFLILLVVFSIKYLKLFIILQSFLKLLIPILGGFIIAWLLYPFYKKLKRNLNKSAGLVVIITLMILVYSLIICLIIPLITKEGANLYNQLFSFIQEFKKMPFSNEILSLSGKFESYIITLVTNIPPILIDFFLAHFLSIYFLFYFDNIIHFLKRVLLKFKLHKIKKFLSCLNKELYCYIKGTLIDMLVLFIISLICFSILGLNYSPLLALFASITNVIPLIGPYLGGIPAFVVALSMSFKKAIIVVVLIIIIQLLESNLINPFIMSKCTKINPLIIVISLIIIGGLFGIVGMIFTIPILITIKLILYNVDIDLMLKKTNLGKIKH